jgi:hypothetical protein
LDANFSSAVIVQIIYCTFFKQNEDGYLNCRGEVVNQDMNQERSDPSMALSPDDDDTIDDASMADP